MPRSPWWAIVPAASIVVVVFGIEADPGSADLLTWLALVAVPPLAAFALGWLVHGATPAWALLAVPLFALAWASQGSLAAETAATLLSGFACIALGWLLVSVVDPGWLRWGIYAMAAIDAVLITADLLQGPSGVLSAADPGGLPRLQVLEFGAARMGFGDAFVAATAGCLLALPVGGRSGGPDSWPCWRSASTCFSSRSTPCPPRSRSPSPWRSLSVSSVGVADEGDRVDRDEAGHGQRHPPP